MFHISLLELQDDADFSGRGVRDGIVLYLGASVARKNWLRLLAHESLHLWISRAIGGFPLVNPDEEAWLNEGFVEAYTSRFLLEFGLWDVAQFVADWNASLLRYGVSPVRNAPNSRILADRQRDFDINKLPYDRGRILAVYWDRELRAASNSRIGLDAVLREQMEVARANELRGVTTSADRLFPVVVEQLSNIKIKQELVKYVENGDDLTLAPGAFGPCVAIDWVLQPVFDRGIDMGASLKAHGKLVGLEPGGPAERAGLREGDQLLIDEIPNRDSRVALHYEVVGTDGQRRNVSFKPEGATMVSFQQLSALGPLGSTRCHAGLLRP